VVTRVLLDTQAWFAAYEGQPLPKKVQTILADPDTERIVSAVSILEIALKNSIGKTDFSEENVRRSVRDLKLSLISFTPQHSYRLFSLPLHHRDPFDRMLIATALAEQVPIISSDRQLKQYKGLRVIW
jgi:PIN domain nuclease of toxin-antitoxin system